MPQYERVFQVLEYLSDGDKPTESPGWQSPKRPTFIRGSTAIAASVPACAKFETTFSGLRLLPWQEETPYPPEAVWLVQTPIDSPVGVAEEPIDPKPLTSTIVPPVSDALYFPDRSKTLNDVKTSLIDSVPSSFGDRRYAPLQTPAEIRRLNGAGRKPKKAKRK